MKGARFNFIFFASLLIIITSLIVQAQPLESFAEETKDEQEYNEFQVTGYLTNSINKWVQLTSSAEWIPRHSHTSVKLPDNSIVLIGGHSPSHLTLNKDVWRSTDKGSTWTLMTASAEWADWETYEEGRYDHTSVVLPDGSIVLMGGWGGWPKNRNDVFRSTDKGASWTKMTDNTEWPGRRNHSSVVLSDGSIVLMGGKTNEIKRIKNDVWRSTDKGASWTLMTSSAGWPERYGHSSVVLPDDSIILMGGADQDEFARVTRKNDVWRSTDQGVTWSKLTDSAEWEPRSGHTSVVMSDGSIVLMGGGNNSDVWRSTDQGVTWSKLTDSAEWGPRSGHTSVTTSGNSVVLMGGHYGTSRNDVWLSTKTTEVPTITSVSPASPEVKSTKQPFIIYGDNFETGLEIVLTSHGGNEYVIPRDENPFIEVTPQNKIEVNAGFTTPGNWHLRVVNPDGQESDNYSFIVYEEELPDEYTHRVAYIPVEYKDPSESLPVKSIADLKNRADLVSQYYKIQSYSTVDIEPIFLTDERIELDKTCEEYIDEYGVNWFRRYVIRDSMDKAGILPDSFNTNPWLWTEDIEEYDAVMVLAPTNNTGGGAFAMSGGHPNLLNITFVEDRYPYATWAHELGHGIFKWFDYYPREEYVWTRGYAMQWCLMGGGRIMNPPAQVMTYHKALAGWLNYIYLAHDDYGQYNIGLLHELSYGDEIYRYKPFAEHGLTDDYPEIDYFLIEGRSPEIESEDIAPDEFKSENRLEPDLGINLYYQLERDEEEEHIDASGTYIYRIPHQLSGNRTVTLTSGDSHKCDYHEVQFEAVEVDGQLQLSISEHRIADRCVIFAREIKARIAELDISQASSLHSDYDLENEFDTNLVIYTEDGLMVGMCYETDEYIMEIPGARSSGNIPGGGPEWISIPNNIEMDYKINTDPAKDFFKETGLTEISISTTVETIEIDEIGERTITKEETVEIDLYNINLTANPEEGGEVSGGGVFEPGEKVTVTATPSAGYEFVNWTEDGAEISTDSSFTFTLTEYRELVANYTSDSTFPDVPPDHPFFDEIEALAASGITEGYDDGTFRPSANITRMAMAAFLERGLELEDEYEVPAEPTFPDVPIDHPFFDEIELLAASGITEGYDDGTFRPSNNVTRMAMAAFLKRGLDLDEEYEVPDELSFTDVSSDHPFYEEIELLAASGVTTGYDDGTFKPSNNVTRMAMAAFLVRGLDLQEQ